MARNSNTSFECGYYVLFDIRYNIFCNYFTWVCPLVAYRLGPCPTLPEVPKRSEAEVYSLIDCALHAPTTLTIWHVGFCPFFGCKIFAYKWVRCTLITCHIILLAIFINMNLIFFFHKKVKQKETYNSLIAGIILLS